MILKLCKIKFGTFKKFQNLPSPHTMVNFRVNLTYPPGSVRRRKDTTMTDPSSCQLGVLLKLHSIKFGSKDIWQCQLYYVVLCSTMNHDFNFINFLTFSTFWQVDFTTTPLRYLWGFPHWSTFLSKTIFSFPKQKNTKKQKYNLSCK